MGGRLDATNVTRPAATVVTPLGLEHTEFLGDNLVSIAREKLGIARRGVPCVLAQQPPEAAHFLLGACVDRGIPPIEEGKDYIASGSPEAFRFSSPGLELGESRLALKGRYQVQNAGLAVAGCRALLGSRVPFGDAFRDGLAAAVWPGRFDLRQTAHGEVLFDGAHNAVAASALVDAFTSQWEHRPAILVALKKDKDSRAVLDKLAPLARAFVFTTLPGGGSHAPEDLAGQVETMCPVRIEPDPEAALRRLGSVPALPGQAGAPNVCCGSLFLVGYYMARLAPPKDATEQQS